MASLDDIRTDKPIRLTAYQDREVQGFMVAEPVAGLADLVLGGERARVFLEWASHPSRRTEIERDLQGIAEDGEGQPLLSTRLALPSFRDDFLAAGPRDGGPDVAALADELLSATAGWTLAGADTVVLDGYEGRWFPVTVWQTYTDPLRMIEVRHTDIRATSRAEALARADAFDGEAWLRDDGGLELVSPDGGTRPVPEGDVRIKVYTRPPETRGVPFIPDPSTPEGRARIAATFTDPAYISGPEDYCPESISLRDLAASPGGAGRLGSVAYDAELAPAPGGG